MLLQNVLQRHVTENFLKIYKRANVQTTCKKTSVVESFLMKLQEKNSRSAASVTKVSGK